MTEQEKQKFWDRVDKVWRHLRDTETRKHWKTDSYEILWLLACAELGEKDPNVTRYGKCII